MNSEYQTPPSRPFCIVENFPPYIVLQVLYFQILVLLEYLVSAESRRPFKPVLGGTRAAALSI